MTDEEIIGLYFARDERAISETKVRFGKLLRGVAYGILRNCESAEECENDVYFRAWNSIPPAKPKYLRAYLCKIARSAALDKYDSEHALKRGETSPLEEIENALKSSVGAEDRLAERELTELINDFLAALDKKSRVIFVRRYWFADDIEQIALRLNMSQGAVKTRLSRTVKKLGEKLAENDYH